MSDNYYADAYYEVWRSGGNPDRLDRDNVSRYQSDGYSAYEAAECEMRSWRRSAERARMEREQERLEEEEYYRRQYDEWLSAQAEEQKQNES